MAQGSVTLFEEFRKTIGDGSHDLDNDTFAIMLVNNTLVPTAAQATPDSADFTEVSGTNYSAGGIVVTATWIEVGGTATFATTSNAQWIQSATAPSDIYYAIIYNQSHAGTTDAVGFIDMTPDGGTSPISLISGDITVNAGTIFTLA